MGEHGTIRQRIQAAAEVFKRQEAVVLTTFNLSASFLEEQALPAVLGVEARAAAAKRAETHQRLGATACAVFYDPTAAPKISGRYRYVARPVPLRGRFFHPKLVIMAGRADDESTRVYLAVSSANLSMSGWGRNAEAFGELWIRSKNQQAWGKLDAFLEWFQSYAPLGEERSGADAVGRVRAALARMPERRRVEYYGRFYSSVTHPAGFADFLQMGRARRARELWVYSPYWSDVAEQVKGFGARRTVLVPALRVDGASLGLAQEQAEELPKRVEVRRNLQDVGDRFWHMKAYRIFHGHRAYTAVGSCNFTRAGLAGGGGNVEAALLFEAELDSLPECEPAELEELASEVTPEEEAPEPAPVAIVVAFDWRSKLWRWWLDAGPGQRDFVLHLPGLDEIPTESGTHEAPGEPPGRGARFEVTYWSGGEARSWEGQVVELHLDHSSRVYGQPLTANEILESWRGRAVTWDVGGGGLGGDGEEGDERIEHEASAAFDAVNLYDLYRSIRGLRAKLQTLVSYPEAQRALLVGRPDSVMALGHLACREGEAPVVRYLVLREILGVIRAHGELLEEALVTQVAEMAGEARARTLELVAAESAAGGVEAEEILDWFEARLAELDRGAA